MTSISMYRKWRPQSFEEISGQDHISSTLKQAILQQRISHSYLFCGPRGTGKTTTARVLSKAINCLAIEEGNPCNNCIMCTSSNEGKFLDTIELDAASNRGIDEIRSIKEKINFLPTEGSKKVYIIDEAHMLTDQASNAFLKTLEEPPSHVTFILCTTEPQKILPTILSRCQRYDFRKITHPIVVQRLQSIIESEGIVAENSSLEVIAQSCDGSLRDAETILEQMIVSTNGNLTRADVESFIGISNPSQWVELVNLILNHDTAGSIRLVNESLSLGIESSSVHKNVMNLLRSVMLYQLDPSLLQTSIYNLESDIKPLANRANNSQIIQYLSLWNEVSFKNTESGILLLELLIVKLTTTNSPEVVHHNQTPESSPVPKNVTTTSAKEESKETRASQETKPYVTKEYVSQDQPNTNEGSGSNHTIPKPTEVNSESELLSTWNEIIRSLGRQKGEKFNLGALLRDCDKTSLEIVDGKMTLYFKNRANFERMEEEMSSPISYNKVSDTFKKHLNQDVEINLDIINNNGTQKTSSNALQNSPLVRVAMGMGAHVVQEKSDE